MTKLIFVLAIVGFALFTFWEKDRNMEKLRNPKKRHDEVTERN